MAPQTHAMAARYYPGAAFQGRAVLSAGKIPPRKGGRPVLSTAKDGAGWDHASNIVNSDEAKGVPRSNRPEIALAPAKVDRSPLCDSDSRQRARRHLPRRGSTSGLP